MLVARAEQLVQKLTELCGSDSGTIDLALWINYFMLSRPRNRCLCLIHVSLIDSTSWVMLRKFFLGYSLTWVTDLTPL